MTHDHLFNAGTARRATADTPDAEPCLAVQNLHKTYRMGDDDVHVLRGVSMEIMQGQFVAIEGRSGSGKSTLLHLMGLLDTPDEGKVIVEGADLAAMPSAVRNRFRNTVVGFVFQFYHLLPELNVLQNTQLAAMVKYGWLGFRSNAREIRQRAEGLLHEFGMSHRLKHRPNQLSGGERQRVAIARALMNEPRILLADEPTGNLDTSTGRQIMEVLEKLHGDRGQTVVMVTHDRTLARQADRSYVLVDGVLVAE